jgi:hypothetical protein
MGCVDDDPRRQDLRTGFDRGAADYQRSRLAVTAVELGANLAAVARRLLAGFPAAEVATCSFEDWRPDGTGWSRSAGPN